MHQMGCLSNLREAWGHRRRYLKIAPTPEQAGVETSRLSGQDAGGVSRGFSGPSFCHMSYAG